MKLVEWDESFSIHVPEIDEQHKTWLDIINTLHESLLTSSGLETLTESTLQSMLDYAHKHFAYEEQFMRDIAFPDTDEHTLLHAQFLQKIHSLDKRNRERKIVLNRELMKELTGWLTQHILHEDKQIGLFLQNQQHMSPKT